MLPPFVLRLVTHGFPFTMFSVYVPYRKDQLVPLRQELDGDAVTKAETVSDAVAGVVADLGINFGGPSDTSSEAVATPDVAQETVDDYNPQVPDEIEMFLAEDDLGLDDEPAEPVEPGEYQDPDELARRLVKAERALAHEREQRIRVSLKSWKAEGQKFFPLADLDNIKADSRRGYLRAARDQHERNVRILKPQIDALAAQQRAALDAAAQADQAREAAAWGRPVTGGGAAPPASTTADERLAQARKRGDFRASVGALLERI